MKHKYYKLNEEGRDFIVGDLHGCYDELFKHLDDLKFNYEIDRLFSVGDLIDRGEKSFDCLKLIMLPWFHAVMGNHEDMMLNVVLGDTDPYLWVMNGGAWYGAVDLEELKTLCKTVDELPIAITIETREGLVGVCHAQPPLQIYPKPTSWSNAQTPTFYDQNIMLWGRDIINHKLRNEKYEVVIKDIDKVYCGHTVLPEPKVVGNIEFIDTGCVFKTEQFVGKLTIKEL